VCFARDYHACATREWLNSIRITQSALLLQAARVIDQRQRLLNCGLRRLGMCSSHVLCIRPQMGMRIGPSVHMELKIIDHYRRFNKDNFESIMCMETMFDLISAMKR
jgi:hypothetical protein